MTLSVSIQTLCVLTMNVYIDTESTYHDPVCVYDAVQSVSYNENCGVLELCVQ